MCQTVSIRATNDGKVGLALGLFPFSYQLSKRFWESDTCFFPKTSNNTEQICRNIDILYRVQKQESKTGRIENQTDF